MHTCRSHTLIGSGSCTCPAPQSHSWTTPHMLQSSCRAAMRTRRNRVRSDLPRSHSRKSTSNDRHQHVQNSSPCMSLRSCTESSRIRSRPRCSCHRRQRCTAWSSWRGTSTRTRRSQTQRHMSTSNDQSTQTRWSSRCTARRSPGTVTTLDAQLRSCWRQLSCSHCHMIHCRQRRYRVFLLKCFDRQTTCLLTGNHNSEG